MVFEEWISQLFDNSERLHAVRSDLLKIADSISGHSEKLRIILSIKAIDLMRIMLLYEYELLDTSHVIQDDYVSSYYARRIEILVMAKEQISGQLKELEDLRRQIYHTRASDCIDQAGGIIGSSLRVVNDTVTFLENEIVAAGTDRTKH
jgi:hypothetical protein